MPHRPVLAARALNEAAGGYELAEKARRMKKRLQVIVVSDKLWPPRRTDCRKAFGQRELAGMMEQTTNYTERALRPGVTANEWRYRHSQRRASARLAIFRE